MDAWTPANLIVSCLGVIVTLLLGMVWWFLRRTISENDRAHRNMVDDIAGLKSDMAVVKTDVAGLKTDMAVVKTDVAGLKTDVAGLKTGMTGITTELAAIRTIVEQGRSEPTRQ